MADVRQVIEGQDVGDGDVLDGGQSPVGVLQCVGDPVAGYDLGHHGSLGKHQVGVGRDADGPFYHDLERIAPVFDRHTSFVQVNKAREYGRDWIIHLMFILLFY